MKQSKSKSKFQQKTKKVAEIEETEEENIPSDENFSEELEEDEEQVPEEEEIPESESPEEKPEKEPEAKSVAENKELSNKQKIKALKRALETKTYALEKAKDTVKGWRSQAADRDNRANTEYQKRKAECEEMLKKIEERYQKRIARTKKWWLDYSDNVEKTKIF